MQSARCLPIIMKYPLILCSVLASLSTSIARKHGPHSGPPDLRIVGGYEASLRSHPYIVSLQIDLLFFQQHFCGGSVLNERWILTAAHCVNGSWLKNWRSIVAVVGTNDNKNKDSTAQTLRISERIPHPNYNGEKSAHDIAMLKTATNIQYNDAVYPINFPLPMRGTQKFQNLILAGWGLLESPKPPYYVPALSDKLQEVQVEYIPMDECKKAIDAALEAIENPARVEEISNYDLDTNGQICTGPITGGVSACNGDSGGPLIQYISIKDFTTDTTQITTEDIEYENTASDDSDSVNKELTDDTRRRKTKKIFAGFADKVQKYKDDGLIPVLIGLVSWSIKPCGKVGTPNINTNVSTYADFIHKHLND